MKKITWFILVLLFSVIGALSLSFIQNHNLDSQNFELNKFQACKLLYLESLIKNVSENTSNECAISSLIKSVEENNKYLDDQKKIFIHMFVSIISSVSLIVLSIIHPFKEINK